MPLKVITIDFWNTLFDSSNGTERNNFRKLTLINEIDKYEIMIKGDEFNDALKASWEYFNNVWLNDMRTPTPFETAEFLWKYLKLPFNEDSIKNISQNFGEAILVYPPNLIDGVIEALEILHQKYKLGIVSDTGFSTGTHLKQLMERNSLLQYFDAFSFSDETGVSKPHPKVFQIILNTFNVSPEEALHVGDIEQTDIVGAKKLGMKAIRFSGDIVNLESSDYDDSTKADAKAKTWGEVVKAIEYLNRI
jgi:HAD superfamily hydrolase (TIGR01549 family)